MIAPMSSSCVCATRALRASSMSTSMSTSPSTLSSNIRVPSFIRWSKSGVRSSNGQRVGAADPKISGVVFEPFSAVESELATTQKAPSSASYGRTDFHPECEAAINEQINIEYNVSYVYHAMYTYFARDNVGLTNIAEFFKNESAEERHHAELLMDYQIKRGGVVKLETIMPPHTEFDHPEKGDALYAFELALSLEKLNFQKLRHLHEVAEKHGDSQMCDFIEGGLLADQMQSVYEVAEKVAQLRRVGKGLGVYVFDQELGGGQA